MFKVVAVSDKKNTAIDRLCTGVAKYHDNIEYVVCDVHPKRPDQQQLDRFTQHAITADVIDFQYYRTAYMLQERFAWLKDKYRILTHNNPYSIFEGDWNDMNIVVANNQTMRKDLEGITDAELEMIPLTVDTDFWKFNRDFDPKRVVIMVANRIESKKGILDVALACQDVGAHMILVGSISDRSYFDAVMATECVEFHENITDEKLRELYYKSTLHVCNSKDNFESGTLPILEAMLCGVPVLTRKVGHVPDLYNGENMGIISSQPDNVEHIASKIHDMLSDKKGLETMRQKAWDTAKTRSHERRAYEYQKLYRRSLSGMPVSVVMPIYKDERIIRQSINAVVEQTHKNIELIVCDDGDNKDLIDSIKPTVDIMLRYINTNQNDYGLARARNEGIIEATGDLIVFCDERMVMDQDAVAQFVANARPNTWLFGDKNGKKSFVENFSAISRKEIIKLGMFNERITAYGGMSQDIRARANLNNVVTKYLPEAKATPLGKSSNKHTKKQEIIAMKNRLYKMGLE